jgi:UDPglucose 6-dehydrogenase
VVITVIGGGFVGTVSAACLCEFGFNVWLCDEDPAKVKRLQDNVAPSDEPGIEQALARHATSGRLTFSEDVYGLVHKSDIIIISVPTLIANSDSDMSGLHNVVEKVSLELSRDHYTAMIIKTNVPVGACSVIANNVRFLRPDIRPGEQYDVIANPGILREGSAMQDFVEPNFVLVGTNTGSEASKNIMLQMYAPLVASRVQFVFASFETVELVRAATIGFSTVKMTYINEIADVCSRCEADINTVIKCMTLDHEIGNKALKVSPGFGGTSFPRTVRILSQTAKSLGVDLSVINTVIESNRSRISAIKPRIMKLLYGEEGKMLPIQLKKKVAILGLSFKPFTSDIKESPSIFVISDLLKEENIEVNVYDPLFKPVRGERSIIPPEIINHKNFSLSESAYDAVSQSDILVIMTNWNEFISLDFKKIRELMNKLPNSKPTILDYKNMFSPKDMKTFNYISQGQ